jgi:NitT/TauT family transport system ATP-binding protein
VVASATATTPKVELRDVNLRYFGLEGETEALQGVSISIAPGEFVAIIGQSGCGKSTLLSLISGILMPTGGTVLVDGKSVTGPSRKVGYMLQQDYLFEWRTILENAVLGAEIQNADMSKARERASALLTRYGLGQFLHHRPRPACASALRSRARCARSPTSSCSTSLSPRSIHRRGSRWPTKSPSSCAVSGRPRFWSPTISAKPSAWRSG